MSYRQKYVQCISPTGLHRMAYTEWGDPANTRVVVCVHGLTRSGRDFDELAAALSGEFRVVCPDVAGRGLSDRLADASAYGVPQYVADMMVLIGRLDVEQVDWVGTSMGGLIGMTLASLPQAPIRRLVLNDVGPLLTADALRRIGDYVGLDPRWDSFEEALAYMKVICRPFGTLSEGQWERMTAHSVAARPDGSWGFRYDPRIAEPFRQGFTGQDIDLWPVYERIKCPTLVMRGALSDLLTAETWQAMGERGPKAARVQIDGVGHAPMFTDAGQIAPVRAFLGGA